MKKLILLLSFVPFLVSAQREGHVVGESANIYFQRWGTGKPILIVGELGYSSVAYEHIARQLSKHNQVIIYDQRGTGKTRVPHLPKNGPAYLAKCKEDLRSVLNVLKLSQALFLVVGNGKLVVDDLITEHADKVLGYIEISAGRTDTLGRSLPVISLLGRVPTRPTPQWANVPSITFQTIRDFHIPEVETFLNRNGLTIADAKTSSSQRSRNISRKRH
ncbi:MAG: hypothetical protein QM669_06280 [Siphonobacter sp.]